MKSTYCYCCNQLEVQAQSFNNIGQDFVYEPCGCATEQCLGLCKTMSQVTLGVRKIVERPLNILLVTGGRDYRNIEFLFLKLFELKPDIIIEGGAIGADSYAEFWARGNTSCAFERYDVKEKDWGKYGKGAGPRRNLLMMDRLMKCRDAGHETKVVAFHDNLFNSKGTKHMVKQALRNNYVVDVFDNHGRIIQLESQDLQRL